MEDFSMFKNSFDNYLDNLQEVLKIYEEENLVLNWEKCHFMVTQGNVLGHLSLANGIQGDKAKIDLISGLPIPKSVRDIQSFLGHIRFYKRFIKDFNAISRSVSHLLMKDAPFKWSKECQASFRS